MHGPKVSKNSEFLQSLIRKKPKTSEIIEHAKRLSFNDTEYLIENKVFNQDIVLYAKSQNSKQK